MFDVDDLIAQCQAAIAEGEPHRAVREVLERTMADADDVADAMRPREGGLNVLYSAPDLDALLSASPGPGLGAALQLLRS